MVLVLEDITTIQETCAGKKEIGPSKGLLGHSPKMQEVFELPRSAAQVYVARSPWQADRTQPAITLIARQKHTFDLLPFQVMTLEAAPRK